MALTVLNRIRRPAASWRYDFISGFAGTVARAVAAIPRRFRDFFTRRKTPDLLDNSGICRSHPLVKRPQRGAIAGLDTGAVSESTRDRLHCFDEVLPYGERSRDHRGKQFTVAGDLVHSTGERRGKRDDLFAGGGALARDLR